MGESVQTTFVDDPRNAVENADALVAELMQRLADGFARERERLEGRWSRGEDVSTEDLRVVLPALSVVLPPAALGLIVASGAADRGPALACGAAG